MDPEGVDPEKIEQFIEAQGAAWGARRDVVSHAKFNLLQSRGYPRLQRQQVTGPLELQASFDEFNLDIRLTYAGPPLELPETRPSNEEIVLASEDAERRLAGFLLRSFADRVSVTHADGRSTVLFHFDH